MFSSAARGIGALAVSLIVPLLTFLANDRVSVPVPTNFTQTLIATPIQRLQSYLQIRTDHGVFGPNYYGAAAFLNRTVADLLPEARFSVYEFVSGKPVVLVTLLVDNSVPTLLLNSHTDVVPAEEGKWKWAPFEARLVYEAAEWRVYARGAQDMKSIGMQYLEALSALYQSGWRPQRSIAISFVPDEEIGGQDGMQSFLKSRVFRNLNVGVVLDEGLPNSGAAYNVYCGERQAWWLAVKVEDNPGHAGTFPPDTAAQRLQRIIGSALNFRAKQVEKLAKSGVDIGEVIGVNLVYMKAGQVDGNMPTGHIMNMVPSVAEAGFDIRVPPQTDPGSLQDEIESWLQCEGGKLCAGTTYKWVMKVQIRTVTSCDSSESPHFAAFKQGLKNAGIADRLRIGILGGSTDARFLRQANIPAFGFSPIENTANLLHEHDEYISMDGYLRGCKVYEEILKEMSGPPLQG